MESLQCSSCGCKESKVLETRTIKLRGNVFKIRIRECRHCGLPFRTKEVTVPDEDAPLPDRMKKKKSSQNDSIPTVYNPFTEQTDNPNDEKLTG